MLTLGNSTLDDLAGAVNSGSFKKTGSVKRNNIKHGVVLIENVSWVGRKQSTNAKCSWRLRAKTDKPVQIQSEF